MMTMCQFGRLTYGQNICGAPAVALEYGYSGRCAKHTESALARTKRLHAAAETMEAALEDVWTLIAAAGIPGVVYIPSEARDSIRAALALAKDSPPSHY